jgi:hypothetical protein
MYARKNNALPCGQQQSVVRALQRAAENGKSVTVLFEARAVLTRKIIWLRATACAARAATDLSGCRASKNTQQTVLVCDVTGT